LLPPKIELDPNGELVPPPKIDPPPSAAGAGCPNTFGFAAWPKMFPPEAGAAVGGLPNGDGLLMAADAKRPVGGAAGAAVVVMGSVLTAVSPTVVTAAVVVAGWVMLPNSPIAPSPAPPPNEKLPEPEPLFIPPKILAGLVESKKKIKITRYVTCVFTELKIKVYLLGCLACKCLQSRKDRQWDPSGWSLRLPCLQEH